MVPLVALKRGNQNPRAVWDMSFSRIHTEEQKAWQLVWTSVVSITKRRRVKAGGATSLHQETPRRSVKAFLPPATRVGRSGPRGQD